MDRPSVELVHGAASGHASARLPEVGDVPVLDRSQLREAAGGAGDGAWGQVDPERVLRVTPAGAFGAWTLHMISASACSSESSTLPAP